MQHKSEVIKTNDTLAVKSTLLPLTLNQVNFCFKKLMDAR